MKKGIIVTSFGTTHEDTRKLCIEPIEDRIRNAFKDKLVVRAFTSRVIISRLKKRDNYIVDNPTEALEKMKEKAIKDIYIQPLLIIPGHEYDKVFKEVDTFLQSNNGFNVEIGKPLLSDDEDYENVINALDLGEDVSDEANIFMGHGTDHNADYAYEKIEKTMRAKGHKNVFMGTVEGKKTIEDIVVKLKEREIDLVNLRPFMLVAGDHAKNDMASDDEDSWKSILEANEIKVKVEISGLGEIKAIQDIFKDHLRNMME